MSAQQVFRMRSLSVLMALAVGFPVFSYAASAANVDFSVGSVTAVDAAGAQRPLSRGAEIGNGDTIRTGDGGRAQVRFSDGAMVSLQPQTEFRIDSYQYSGKDDGQEKGFFSLLKGGLRTITGLIGRSNRDNYRVSTSIATIGIRGTEYSAGLNGENLDVATGEGSVIVCNDQGCVILSSGEAGGVQGHGRPQRRHTHPRLPPAPILQDIQPVFSSGDLGIGQQSLLTGTQTYSTAYANFFSSSCCTLFSASGTGTGTIDATGTLTAFAGASGPVDANVAGGNSLQQFGNDGVVAWGRWINNGNGFTTGDPSLSAGAGGTLHYVAGIPTFDSQPALASLYGSSATYTLVGGGVSGRTSGPGSITSASMTVDFLAASVPSVNIGMTVGGFTYNLSDTSNPRISGFGTAPGFASTSANVLGGGCSTGCAAGVSGAFFGAGAARAGVAFDFLDAQKIVGTAALKK